MQIVASTVNTKDVEVTIKATMSIAYWEALLENLPESQKHPLYQFANVVKDAVSKVKNVVESESTN